MRHAIALLSIITELLGDEEDLSDDDDDSVLGQLEAFANMTVYT